MSPTMTAAVLHGARDVRIETYPRPELRPGMALLRVRRVGMCGSDLHYFQHAAPASSPRGPSCSATSCRPRSRPSPTT